MEPEDYPDEEPITEEEIAYGWAYAEALSVGGPEPDASAFDPERAARIREVVEREWRTHVRRITHGPRRRRR